MLKNIQEQFLNVILNQSTDMTFVSSPQADERINIYRQTILENIRNSLSIIYPGIWQLLGNQCADNLAKAFVMHFKQLPNSGCLDDFGSGFPDFINKIPELNHLYYLYDYANYEFKCHQLYAAVDSVSIDLTYLQHLSESHLDNLCLKFIEASALLSSNHPLDLIKDILGDDNISSIQLPNRPSFALLARVDNQLMTYWLEQDLWMFIHYLHHGMKLNIALEKVNQKFSNFDLSFALYFIFEKKLVQSCNTSFKPQ